MGGVGGGCLEAGLCLGTMIWDGLDWCLSHFDYSCVLILKLQMKCDYLWLLSRSCAVFGFIT